MARVIAVCTVLLASFLIDFPLLQARQSTDGRPLEYIESSSPLPGGGVVSSVFYPVQPTPAVSTAPVTGQGNSVLVRETGSESNQPRLALLPTGYVYPQANYANPTATYMNPSQIPYDTQPNMSPGTFAQQAPSLGVPVPWNRAFRPGFPGSGPNPSYSGSPIYGPANLSGPYQPLVKLQNMQPSAYPGQGIIGSPKMYVDGQPVRNLLRYLIIP